MHALFRHIQGTTLLVALFSAVSGSAAAQQPITPNTPLGTITVFEGQSQLYTAQQPLVGILVSDSKVCTIATAEPSPFTHFAVNGVKRGVAQITLAINPQAGGPPYDSASYVVVVVPDPNARKAELDNLAMFIQNQFPTVTGLKVMGVPGSPKVVVSGVAPDEWTAVRIIEMVTSEKIPFKHVINDLMVVCPPPSPPGQRCCGLHYPHVHGR